MTISLFEKSFQAQKSDYLAFHRGQLGNTIESLKQVSQQLDTPSKFSHVTAQVTLINRASLEALQSQRTEIIHLFYTALRLCDYDRSAIKHDSLEYILDEKVFKASSEPASLDPVTNRKIHNTFLEALFAARLGIEPEKADSDFHEVYYLLDRSKKRLGVLKQITKIPSDQECYGSADIREAHIAEVASFKLDQLLKTSLVPFTSMLSCELVIKGKSCFRRGSFQFYVADAVFLLSKLKKEEGADLFNPNHALLRKQLNSEENQQLSFENFEEFVFLNIWMGNNDTHFRNIFVKKGKLIAIDNGNSFPWCHNKDRPKSRRDPLHWFKWSTLPHAQYPFSKKLIDLIRRVDLGQIEQEISQALVDEETPSSKEHYKGKINTFRDRFETIKKLATEGKTMKEIADAILELTAY